MDYTVTDPAGNEHVISGPEGASDSEILEAAQNLFTPGALESAGRAAVNNLPLGGQLGAIGTAALNPATPDYSTALKNWNDQAALAKAGHPIAYGAGAVAGSVAPLAIPGVGEALGAESIGARALAGGALGAANAVGNTDLTKNPQEALKEAGLGALTGGTIGALIPGTGKAEEGLESYANRKTVQASGLPPGLLNVPKDELEQMGSTMHEMGLDAGSMDDKVNIAQAKLQEVGAKIGALGANVPPLQDATPFINQLHDRIQESSDIFGAGANPEAPLYQAGVDKLSQPNLTFEQLQKMKTAIGDRAFDSLGNVRNDAAANLYAVYKDAMKSIVNGAPEEYQSLMDQYGNLLDINTALGKMRGIQNAGGLPAKGFGMVGKMGAMVTGGNVPATVGLAAALAPAHPFMAAGALTGIVNNPGAMAGAARGIAGALPTATGAARTMGTDAMLSHFIQNPAQYGRFSAPLMQAVQQGGSQGFAATSFILRQQHPELNDIMLEASKHSAKQGMEHTIHEALTNEGE